MKYLSAFLIFFLFATSAMATGDEPLYKLAPVSVRQANARPDIPGHVKVEFGWNFLENEPAPMAINSFGSRTFNVTYSYEFPVGNFGLYIVPGIGLGLDRFKFDNDFTLSQDADGNVSFVDLAEVGPKKSHLVANYVDIPIEFRFYVNNADRKRSFHIGFGGKFGVLFSSHTKIKFDEGGETVIDKEKRSFGLNPFRYGAIGRLGYGGVSAFTYVSLSELFEDGPAGTNDTTNWMIGLSVNLF